MDAVDFKGFVFNNMALNYTNIQHNFRKQNNLTLNEYVICDMIFYLSKKSDSKVPNWCFMSKETMAKEIGLSKQSVITLIKKLCDLGFLEKQEVTGFVKTTSRWELVYFTDGKESLPIVQYTHEFGKESLPHGGKESLPNNNTLYNNDNKQILFSDSFYNSYENLKSELSKDEKFKSEYAGVDLRNYIEDCLAWSVSKNKKSTNRGWLLTLRNWMKRAKNENKLVLLKDFKEKKGGFTNH